MNQFFHHNPKAAAALAVALDPEKKDGAWAIAAIKYIGYLRMASVSKDEVTVRGDAQPGATRLSLEELRGFNLWFGEHRGKSVQDIPLDYIRWVLGSFLKEKGNLRNACRNELRIRGTAQEQERYSDPFKI